LVIFFFPLHAFFVKFMAVAVVPREYYVFRGLNGIFLKVCMQLVADLEEELR